MADRLQNARVEARINQVGLRARLSQQKLNRLIRDKAVELDSEDGSLQAQIDFLASEIDRIENNPPLTQWTGPWAAGTYTPNQMAIDGVYLGAANKTTTDRPAPQPDGSEYSWYQGTPTLQSATAKQVTFGARFTAAQNMEINAYRVLANTGATYRVYRIEDPEGLPRYIELMSATASQTTWVNIGENALLVPAGTVFDVVAIVTDDNPVTVRTDLNYNYSKPNNVTDPAAGQMTQANKEIDTLRISKTDADGQDQGAFLLSLTPGDTIDNGEFEWGVQAVADKTTFVSVEVAPATQLTSIGLISFGFEVPTPAPIPYNVDAGYWATSPLTAQGLLSIDANVSGAMPNDDAYGIDIVTQNLTVSPDWDIMAVSLR